MPFLKKLRSYVRQQHVGLLALFVALGGSAYAAATINSASVVDNSLTGADIRGRDASKGKPFTEGTITGADIRGSAAGPGRKAINGSITGVDIFDNALTGADILERSLGKAPNADKLDGLDSAAFLRKTQQAADAAKLGGKDPTVYGTVVYTHSEPTSDCTVLNTLSPCARIIVKVPAGRSYRALVWSSFSAVTSGASVNVSWCPGVDDACKTESGSVENVTTGFGGGFGLSGASSSQPVTLAAGQSTISTLILRDNALASNQQYLTTTTVLLTDATAPSPPTEVCYDACNTSGGSSGTSSGGSSGTSSGGSSGTSSGGSSGTSSGR